MHTQTRELKALFMASASLFLLPPTARRQVITLQGRQTQGLPKGKTPVATTAASGPRMARDSSDGR